MWFAWAGAVVLAIMLLLTYADVIGREILKRPIVANIEMTELLMGLVVYLGVSLTTRVRGHVRVDILLNVLPQRVRAIADAITLFLCALFVSAMAWRLYERAVVKFTKGDETDLWKIPTWPIAAIMKFQSDDVRIFTWSVLNLGSTLAIVIVRNLCIAQGGN